MVRARNRTFRRDHLIEGGGRQRLHVNVEKEGGLDGTDAMDARFLGVGWTRRAD